MSPKHVFPFADGSGFIKRVQAVDILHREALAIDHILAGNYVQPIEQGKHLTALLAGAQWTSLGLLSNSMRLSLMHCTKEIALAACMCEDDWLVQGVPAWPVFPANKGVLISSLVEYLGLIVGKIIVHGATLRVSDVCRLVEVPTVGSDISMLFLRLPPAYHANDLVQGTIKQRLMGDWHHRASGWNCNVSLSL